MSNQDLINLILEKLDLVPLHSLEEIIFIINKDMYQFWSINRNKICNNEETWNIQSGDKHAQDNKNDPNNPIISFGTDRIYECYTLYELLFNWNLDRIKLFGRFTRPDYDPNIQVMLSEYFSLDQMYNLLNMLKRSEPINIYAELINQIEVGIEFVITHPGLIFVTESPEIYASFTKDDKALVHQTLAHLLLISVILSLKSYGGCHNRDSPDEIIIVDKAINDVMDMYFNWTNSLPENVKIFTHSFYRIDDDLNPIRSIYTSKDGTSISYINGNIKCAQEGDYCSATLNHNISVAIEQYKQLFVLDYMTNGQYKSMLEKEIGSILGIDKINLTLHYNLNNSCKLSKALFAGKLTINNPGINIKG